MRESEMADILVREEKPGDYETIHTVEAEAFGRPEEADLVDALRAHGVLALSIVAEIDGAVVGHIAFSPATIVGEECTVEAVALAPVAVTPEHQNKGVGSALVREGLRMCRETGHRIVFLTGHPSYYPRFGFLRGKDVGISCNLVDPSSDAFMVIELVSGALAGCRGVAKFLPEFDGV